MIASGKYADQYRTSQQRILHSVPAEAEALTQLHPPIGHNRVSLSLPLSCPSPSLPPPPPPKLLFDHHCKGKLTELHLVIWNYFF